MAKDPKGHGSNKRGAKVSVTRPVGYTVHGVGPGGVKTLTQSGKLTTVDGKSVNAKDSQAQDRVAADALSSGGPKSAPAPVHEAMGGYSNANVAARARSGQADIEKGMNAKADAINSGGRYSPNHRDSNAFQHDYHPESVNEAIKNSGRFGGGKIGGREARMIHSILKGRGK